MIPFLISFPDLKIHYNILKTLPFENINIFVQHFTNGILTIIRKGTKNFNVVGIKLFSKPSSNPCCHTSQSKIPYSI